MDKMDQWMQMDQTWGIMVNESYQYVCVETIIPTYHSTPKGVQVHIHTYIVCIYMNTTCLSSIWISLACARASKLPHFLIRCSHDSFWFFASFNNHNIRDLCAKCDQYTELETHNYFLGGSYVFEYSVSEELLCRTASSLRYTCKMFGISIDQFTDRRIPIEEIRRSKDHPISIMGIVCVTQYLL